jgi:hypothetical protein
MQMKRDKMRADKKNADGNTINIKALFAVFVASFSVLSTPALAYVGPGAGITMIGALWAVIAGIVLALAGIMIWPIRAYLRRRKQATADADQDDIAAPEEAKSSAKDAAE